ncbi:hypothetical protein [Nakamurella aerolata]|uniref:hypothetical protein n=1 Tax=Nakamurella aerolata TaxID=1656892 RepID=UPI001489C9F3|nr:hypothetical protein [Nakamurella aerolata]
MRNTAMVTRQHLTPQQRIELVQQQLAGSVPSDPLELVRLLADIAAQLEEAMNEAMALAALDGAAGRTIAAAASLAPNSVPPRLARTELLSNFAEDGRVSSEGVAAARFVARRSAADGPAPAAPLTFIPRTSTPRTNTPRTSTARTSTAGADTARTRAPGTAKKRRQS